MWLTTIILIGESFHVFFFLLEDTVPFWPLDVVCCASNFLWLHRTDLLDIARILIYLYRIHCQNLNDSFWCCQGRNILCIKTNTCFYFLNGNCVLIKTQNFFKTCLFYISLPRSIITLKNSSFYFLFLRLLQTISLNFLAIYTML